MHILNIMLGKGKGGLEQAALDYHEALHMAGNNVTSILHPHSALQPTFTAQSFPTQSLSQFSERDWLAARRLRRIAKEAQADIAIAHGNRALGLTLKALKGRVPVIAVAHNYNIKKRFPRADGIFTITRDLLEEMVHLNIPREKLCHMPNMVRMPTAAARTHFRDPPVIGSMGRFVDKKGFDIFLHALKALKDQSVPFRALLGGDGILTTQLQKQAQDFGLHNHLTFTGWVEDKQAFFDQLDIFVLPSQHEPFGIVLIEAMAQGLPCITTDSEGPCEIITHERNAIMVEKARPYQMAQALTEWLENPDAAIAAGKAAQRTIDETYNITIISARLQQALQQVRALVPNASPPI